jgi:hypothetical protein
LEDEFIEQRILLGFKEANIAEDTPLWCGRDLERHPKLLNDYVTNTNPAQVSNYGDDSIDSSHGRVIPGREGEGPPSRRGSPRAPGRTRAVEATLGWRHPVAGRVRRADGHPHPCFLSIG